MKAFVEWIYDFAAAIGGPGLFAIAYLDSSFASLPQLNDILVVLMVTQNKTWMVYYAAMATLGSVTGCSTIYYLARKGGDAFLQKRLRSGHAERALAAYRRHGLLALIVPALLPPPAPFKLFVLMAGVARVPPGRFVAAVAAARGGRYIGLGLLAVWYGDAALELMRTRGRDVALGFAGLIVVTAIGWWWFSRRRG
ncbi:MAG: VTT domain-containing protein [Acidobacteria bacterium]|nr:VTT domain-containing protein [Acidobacteriota bacterium]